jgi:acyl-CoA synthetase (AMP-forming)/AMP-acid ligase II
MLQGFYDTMDAGFRTEEGDIAVMARSDDVINVAGHRLSTGALEEVKLTWHVCYFVSYKPGYAGCVLTRPLSPQFRRVTSVCFHMQFNPKQLSSLQLPTLVSRTAT